MSSPAAASCARPICQTPITMTRKATKPIVISNRIENLSKSFTLHNQGGAVIRVMEGANLSVEPPALERLVHLDDELLLRERLLDVVEGPQPHGLHGAFDGAVGGHHDHLGHGLRFLDRPQHLDAVVFPHAEVRDHHVISTGGPLLAPLGAIGGFVHLEAPAAQHHGQGGAHVALIVDDQDLSRTADGQGGALLRRRGRPGGGALVAISLQRVPEPPRACWER